MENWAWKGVGWSGSRGYIAASMDIPRGAVMIMD